MRNFTINKNVLFQGEIIFYFFHIHCELRQIPLVKTAKKGVCVLLFFATIALENPYLLSLDSMSNQTRSIPNANLVQVIA